VAEAFSGLFRLFSLFEINVDLINVSCFMSADSAAIKFVWQIASYPIVALITLCVFGLLSLSKRAVPVNHIVNLNGTILFGFFISITLAMLMPFQCVENPNGKYSILSRPGIVCWDSDAHLHLILLSILGMLMYPVTILAVAGYATWAYKNSSSPAKALELQLRHRYLFGRFQRDKYYYGIIFLFRNLLIALVPIVFASVTWLQLVCMCGVVLTGAAIQSQTLPWRTDLLNKFDVCLNLYLIFMLAAAAPMLEDPSQQSLTTFIFTTMMLMLSAFFVVGGYGLFCMWHRKQGSRFAMFLSHHKAAAGALCRFIKISASYKMPRRIFLDSDELDNLDLLLDVVKTETDHLVVILTAGLLQRPWCAAEIATAHRNHVKMLQVTCDDFSSRPSANRMQDMADLWTDSDKGVLMGVGITMEMMEEAYKALFEYPAVSMKRFQGTQQLETCVLDIFRACSITVRAEVAKASATSGNPQVAIACCTTDAEAISACAILRSMCTHTLQVEVKVLRTADDIQKDYNTLLYTMVLLTKGIFQNEDFIEVLLLCYSIDKLAKNMVTILPDNGGFEFPSVNALAKLRKSGIPGSRFEGSQIGSELASDIAALLKVLALPLSPLGSYRLINEQVSEICRRRLSAGLRMEASVHHNTSLQHITNKLSSLRRATSVDRSISTDIQQDSEGEEAGDVLTEI